MIIEGDRKILSWRSLTDDEVVLLSKNKISFRTFGSRARSGNWTLAEALSIPPRKNIPAFTPEQLQIIHRNGLTKQLCAERIRRGKSVIEAITTPKRECYNSNRSCTGSFKRYSLPRDKKPIGVIPLQGDTKAIEGMTLLAFKNKSELCAVMLRYCLSEGKLKFTEYLANFEGGYKEVEGS